MTTVSNDAVHTPAQAGDRVYVRAAVACLVIALVGFVPTFWSPMARGTIDLHRLAYLHALLLYVWLVLFLRQTMLAAAGRLDQHKAWGVFGAGLVGAMVVVSLGLIIVNLKRHDAAGFGDQARAFAIVPATVIVTFAGLFAAALLNTRRPDFHKRIMLVANVSVLVPAIARLLRIFAGPPGEAGGPPPVPFSIVPSMLGNLVIVAAMIHDRRTTGRVHPAYWWAGGALLAVQIARIPLSTLTAWHDVARWLVSMAP